MRSVFGMSLILHKISSTRTSNITEDSHTFLTEETHAEIYSTKKIGMCQDITNGNSSEYSEVEHERSLQCSSHK
ncbi:hypothetical protein RB195_015107 [Necator americanus]|uniref:Uncharacterized protein n=1 Tax=Necator americanus TaxID=51031 RepID=A0ABR1E312_NECAM